jgi:hypothetical protein
MDTLNRDAVMDRPKQNTISPGYALAAAAIWALVLYSLSSLYQPQHPRIALGALQVCDTSR